MDHSNWQRWVLGAAAVLLSLSFACIYNAVRIDLEETYHDAQR